MLREVSLKEAVDAALDGKSAYRINLDAAGFGLYEIDLSAILKDKDKARFLIDDPEADQSAAKAEQTAPKADQNTEKANQNVEKANQSGPEADNAKKPGKTARKDIDIGKVQALHNAGWSIAKIADEMGVSASVIQRRLADVERK